MTDREFYKTVNNVIGMLMLDSPRCDNLGFEIITDTSIEVKRRFETQKATVDMTNEVFFQNLDKIIGMILINMENCRNMNIPIFEEMVLEMVIRVRDLTEAEKKHERNKEYHETINATVKSLLGG